MKHYAIIGGGPRGLYALESLFIAVYNAKSKAVCKVTLFEPFKYPGAGWVWNPEQLESNWLNITERALQNLPGRPEVKIDNVLIPSFPSYSDWLPEKQDKIAAATPDQFPPRAKMGAYLTARFNTMAQVLQSSKWLTIVKETVIALNYIAPSFTAITSSSEVTNIDEVVLTIGHQDTTLSDQLKKWKEHVENVKSPLLFTEAYPIENILDHTISENNVVAFRGFGLAMIDQIRALTLEQGASFKVVNEETKELCFQPSKNHPQRFVPFSLDGLPVVPKPLNEAIDNLFTPTSEMLHAFAKAIHKGACGEHTATDQYFLLEAIADVVVPVFQNLESKAITHDLSDQELWFLVINYINDKKLKHPLLVSHTKTTLEIMQLQVRMATGKTPVSLDYCIGQVWRHCQPTIYSEFSYPKLTDDVVAEVIALDEASKRYSYGPPVESIQQLIAMEKAGFLDLNFTDNPEIKCVNSGWELISGKNSITIDTMINAVLDPPQLVTVTSSIIEDLLGDKIIEPKHTDLGIRTDAYGYVEVPEGKSFVPLAVLGRLSKGSVIGVDAILECFGERTTSWAEHSIKRTLSENKINSYE